MILLCFTGNGSVLSSPKSLGWACYVEASSLQRRWLSSAGMTDIPGNHSYKKTLGLQFIHCSKPVATLCIPCRGSFVILAGTVCTHRSPLTRGEMFQPGLLWHCFPRLVMEEWTFPFSIPSEGIHAASSVLWYSASWGREEPFINISGNTVSTLTCFAHSFSVSRNLSDQNQFTLFY